MGHWSLTTLREKLIKIGAKVTRHAKYVFFQLAEVAVTRPLPIRRCTACWRKKAIVTLFALKPTPCWSGKLSTC